MTDPYTAAEQAAHLAYGTPREAVEAERLNNALAAYRHTLTAAGLLRGLPTIIDAEHAELAARYLAAEAEQAGLPRWAGSNWRMLLTSHSDVNLAYKRAASALTPGDALAAEDLASARRLLNTFIDQANRDGDRP
jgi:hypothetical protein